LKASDEVSGRGFAEYDAQPFRIVGIDRNAFAMAKSRGAVFVKKPLKRQSVVDQQ
jgi:hypothetical protein